MAIWPADPEGAAQYLRDTVPQVVGGAVAGLSPLTGEVWQIDLEGGRRLVAKHQPWGFLTQDQPFDLLAVETEVLGLLGRAGCPVPQVLGCDPQAQFIFFEYCGSHTLEDAYHRAYLPQVVEGLLHIEAVLDQHRSQLEVRVMPQARPDDLLERWTQATARAQSGLEWLAGQAGAGQAALEPARQALEQACAFLATRPPSLGTTDYNPRNLVVDPSRATLSFIEFAKLGWDWTERRLVQYTNTVRSGFGSLLDQDLVARYSARRDENAARALVYHHLVFCLNAAAMLGQALGAPGEHAALLRAWAPLSPRLGQLVRCLRLPLGTDPWAVTIRKVLG